MNSQIQFQTQEKNDMQRVPCQQLFLGTEKAAAGGLILEAVNSVLEVESAYHAICRNLRD